MNNTCEVYDLIMITKRNNKQFLNAKYKIIEISNKINKCTYIVHNLQLSFVNGILVFEDRNDLILKNRSVLMGLLIDDINTINISEHVINILLFDNTRVTIEY